MKQQRSPDDAGLPAHSARRISDDAAAALIAGGFGCVILILSLDYAAMNMQTVGPAYMPRIVGGLLLLLAAVLGARAWAGGGAPMTRFAWRPVLVVAAAIVGFGLLIDRFGLVIAGLAVVIVGGYAMHRTDHRALIMLALAVTAGAVGLFGGLLGLSLKVWP